VQTAPAIRASLAEALGAQAGTLSTGRMVAALRRLGFSRVFDTQFAADLTIMEEGSELLQRLGNGGTLPMITSWSPGWIGFIETFYPTLLPHLSTCKSPSRCSAPSPRPGGPSGRASTPHPSPSSPSCPAPPRSSRQAVLKCGAPAPVPTWTGR
jgi:hypothetical protein